MKGSIITLASRIRAVAEAILRTTFAACEQTVVQRARSASDAPTAEERRARRREMRHTRRI
jgi:hypothetical protein